MASHLDRRDRRALMAMALGFGIGAALFTAGGVMAQIGMRGANATFAVGAVFFTLAAGLQWRVAVWHDPNQGALSRIEFDFRNPDWTSAVTQFVGTLYFNLMTVRALRIGLSTPMEYNVKVWHPDVQGSILFLVSSAIAIHPLSRKLRHRLVRGRSGWIAWLNMVGSVLFAVSALAGRAMAPDQLRSELWSNVGTSLGGAAFLAAAVLLWPGRGGGAHDDESPRVAA